MRGMNPSDRRVMLLRRMAWLCAALVLAVTSLSATIRLDKAGLGCDDWPQCYGQALRDAQRGADATSAQWTQSQGTAVARLVHRVAASTALIIVLVMVMTCFTTRPVLWREGRLALALLSCAVFLTVLGLWTAGARVPAVTIGNLLGGFVMFALCVRLAQSAGRTPARGGAFVAWAWVGVSLLLAQIALGGLVSASFAGLSCPQLVGCDASGVPWQTLSAWREPVLDPADPTHPAGALAHGLHRTMGLLVGVVVLLLGAAAWRAGRRRDAGLVFALLAAQLALGAGLVVLQLPFGLALLHNLVAALLLAAVLSLTLGRLSLR
jgi:cytochrome c oxidase assembly protein subunit 15